AHQPPVLQLGQRARLHDLDGVAGVRLVVLVVHVADGPPLDVLAVALVLDQPRDLHAAGLVHLVAGHHADEGPSLAACLGAFGLGRHTVTPPARPAWRPRAHVPGGWSGCGPPRAWPCAARSASPAARRRTGSGGGTGS